MGALAEFERDLIRERTNAGLAAARARGRVGGKPKKLTTTGKVALARRLFADPNQSISEICSTLECNLADKIATCVRICVSRTKWRGYGYSDMEISRSTLYRYVRDAKRASKPTDPPA